MEFEVSPEVSIRNENIEFILGMPLSQAVNGIQKLSRSIKSVEMIYCQEEPLGSELELNLTNEGIRLVFDQKTQTLKYLQVYDLSKVTLRYCSNIFSTPSDQATASKVDHCFGATHPGVYDSKQQVYTQSWRGLSFAFPLQNNVQTVLSALGSPSRVFLKSDDKMRIHRPSGQRQQSHAKVDYFYNYFTLGMDILFDSDTHTVKKFVLHTNYPGHFDFNIYDRCMFTVELETESGAFNVDPFTKWQDMHELVCEGEGDLSPVHPVVLNRSSSAHVAHNPFGATMCYGHKDMIIEVMSNSHIASLTFFDLDSPNHSVLI